MTVPSNVGVKASPVEREEPEPNKGADVGEAEDMKEKVLEEEPALLPEDSEETDAEAEPRSILFKKDNTLFRLFS